MEIYGSVTSNLKVISLQSLYVYKTGIFGRFLNIDLSFQFLYRFLYFK